jgi:plasmid stabilization system protein ParE
MSYSFLPEAETEYLEAVRFYEEQQAKLGLSLITEFEKVIALVVMRPHAWKQIHPAGIRRVELSRFPYSLFYRVIGNEIQITAFAHHRRRPGYWLKRI